ncbi:MAG: hypothetical protein HC815_05880 [Richelia sp. RM1_1_1]|nr:hypothetical protein [Richelia sp. RM1_1_1]
MGIYSSKNQHNLFKVGDIFGSFVVLEDFGNQKVKCFSQLSQEIVDIKKSELESLTKIEVEQSKKPQTKLRIADLNEQYQLLTVVDNRIEYNKYGQKLIKVRCSCGTQKSVKNYDFVSRKIASCGCLQKNKVSNAKTTHGLYKSKEYKLWLRLKTICLNKNDPSFKTYGGSGIDIYPNWVNSFQSFYEDMGACPEDAVLTRIDPDKGFSPCNCCWLSRPEAKRIEILIQCGVDPKLLIQPKKSFPSQKDLPKETIAAIRSSHAKGESNLSKIGKDFNLSAAEVINVLINHC